MQFNVVFTGPSVDLNGVRLVREDLKKACHEAGIVVQPRIRADTNVLVASREDTVKAHEAVSRGIPTINYAIFFSIFFRGITLNLGGQPCAYTDTVRSAETEPINTSGKMQHELDLIDIL